MKGRITLSIGLALSLMLSLLSFHPPAQGQEPQKKYKASTGPTQLGENQALVLTLVGGVGDDRLYVNFTKITYKISECLGDNWCKLTMMAQSPSGAISLMPSEAISKRLEYDPFVAAFSLNFSSNSRNVQATAFIVDEVTGKVVTRWELILLD